MPHLPTIISEFLVLKYYRLEDNHIQCTDIRFWFLLKTQQGSNHKYYTKQHATLGTFILKTHTGKDICNTYTCTVHKNNKQVFNKIFCLHTIQRYMYVFNLFISIKQSKDIMQCLAVDMTKHFICKVSKTWEVIKKRYKN